MAKNITKKNNSPIISVVMSVYNGEKYLKESIRSILNQTFKDFEFIIINDGSTDSTERIIKSFKDPRIIAVSRHNKGLVASLNQAIRMAKGKYIARQDDDDISLPERLKKELIFMNNHPDCVLVGTAFEVMDENKKNISIEAFPTENNDLKRSMLSVNPFAHGSTLFSRKAAIDCGLYTDKYGPTEDFALWSKMALVGEINNLPDLLYRWRVNIEGISQSRSQEQISYSKIISKENYHNYQKSNLNISNINKNFNFYRNIDKVTGVFIANKYLKTCMNYTLVLLRNRQYLKFTNNFIIFMSGGLKSLSVVINIINEKFKNIFNK